MRLHKKVIIILLALAMAFVLASCNGQSAYDLAVEQGYTGSQADWLASLKGETGATGAQGEKGDKGDTGAQGEKGETGETGVQGPQGEKGDPGTPGDQGEKGETGAAGNGIASIEKTATVGSVDTYTITFTDSTTATFTLTNGVDGKTGNGIVGIQKTSSDGNVDVYTITFSDSTTSTFTVTNGTDGTNGAKGDPGKDGKTVELRVEGEWLQWKYTDETEWKNLYETDGTPPPEGLVSIRYALNGGAMPAGVPETVYVTAGTSIELPTPTYAGYTFVGWYLNENDSYPVTSPYRVHESQKLYAKWKAGAVITGKPIYTMNDLAAIADDLDGTYILMNDINCGGMAIPTIGASASNPFSGIFDGQGYTISNYVASGNDYMGLFGYNSGTIRNLNVADFELNFSTSTSYDSIWVGGIVGYNAGVVEKCSAKNGSIYLAANCKRQVGLIAGENNGALTNCWSTGVVEVTQVDNNDKWALAGGIVGMNRKTVENCYSNAKVTAYGYQKFVNGIGYYGEAAIIVGSNQKGAVVRNCVALGSAEGNNKCGDISAYSGGTIENCYKDVNLSLTNQTNTYATAMTQANLSASDFYAVSLKWDPAIWNFQYINWENGVYPYLIQK